MSPRVGSNFGIVSGNARSCPIITVTGATKIFGQFASIAKAANLAFPLSLLTHTNRAGQQLADESEDVQRMERETRRRADGTRSLRSSEMGANVEQLI
jgi:hypothetical protein